MIKPNAKSQHLTIILIRREYQVSPPTRFLRMAEVGRPWMMVLFGCRMHQTHVLNMIMEVHLATELLQRASNQKMTVIFINQSLQSLKLYRWKCHLTKASQVDMMRPVTMMDAWKHPMSIVLRRSESRNLKVTSAQASTSTSCSWHIGFAYELLHMKWGRLVCLWIF
jgi:hypothetical protein